MKAGPFEARATIERDGEILRYCLVRNGNVLSFREVLDHWEDDGEFVDFYVSIFRQCGFRRIKWETPALSVTSADKAFEFVILNALQASNPPDRSAYAGYFDTKTAPDGIVAFENLGRDALLIVPSPYRSDADYRGLVEFHREAPLHQQRGLWRELGKHAKARLSPRPMWLSVSGDGVFWLHVRLDSYPKYYRYRPFTVAN